MIEVSVVISYFNPDLKLLRALDSVCAQSFKPKQLILIDDGSNNDFCLPSRIVESLRENFEFVHLRNRKNMGLTKSLIKAIKFTSCDYVARLDADDFWLKHHVLSCVRAIESMNLDLVGGRCHIYNVSQKNLSGESGANLLKSFYIFNKLVHSSVVFSLSFYNKIGGYDQSFRYAQDFELWLRFQKNNAKIGFLHSKTIVRELSDSTVSEKYRLEQQNFCVRAIQKNSKSGLYSFLFVAFRKIFHTLGNLKRKYSI